MIPDLAAFVLAGGKSSRMGSDKAFLNFEGRSLIDRILSLAHSVSADVRIVGPRDRFGAFGAIVEDRFPGCGPLGGIDAALATSSTDLNLILAVDMPFLTAGLLGYLVERARAGSSLVTVPRTPDGWQTLCAVYRRSFGPIAEAALRAGACKIDRLFVQTTVCEISAGELAAAGFALSQFQNLNTPQDVEQAATLKPNCSSW